LEWEEKATKPRNGQPGKPFNALKAVTLVEDTVALEMPTADDIPF
jgi:hypothetical protein